MPEEKKHGVAVVVVNFNGAAYIERCLAAVVCQSQVPDEVVVLDNGSSDLSVALVRSHFPGVRLILQPENEGFAHGCNLAIAQTRSPNVLILNTDVFLDRDFLFHGLRTLHANPETGFVAAKILQADSDRIENVGQFLKPWLKTANCLVTDQDAQVFAGSGAALLCRRQMLADVSWQGDPFDASFFMYWEDVDLAWRAQLRGWQCVFSPDSTAHHIGSASQEGMVNTVKKAAHIQRHIWKNRYLLVAQNVSFFELLVLWPGFLLNEAAHWLIPNRLPTFFLAHLDFLRLLPLALRKRRFIQTRRRVGRWAGLRFFRF